MNLSSPGWLFLTRDHDFLRVSVGALGGGCQDPGQLGGNELPNGFSAPKTSGGKIPPRLVPPPRLQPRDVAQLISPSVRLRSLREV